MTKGKKLPVNNIELLSAQEYMEKFVRAKDHPAYQKYKKELQKAAPNFLPLVIRFNLDEKFPERFSKIDNSFCKIIEDFMLELIDEKEYENRLMSLIPKMTETYQFCIKHLSSDELNYFNEKSTENPNGE